jgi:NADH-quinone oxidoreductase subunit L
MGGLRRKLPTTFWAFIIGAASLSAIPLVTDGFYSKDLIIETSLGAVDGNAWLWLGALAGSLLTSIYAFRLVFVVFFGEQQTTVTLLPRWRMKLPLVVLSVLSVVGGFVWLPHWMGGFHPLEDFLDTALPATQTVADSFAYTGVSALLTSLVAVVGVALATVWLYESRAALERFAARPTPHDVQTFWLNGWGFDWLYEHVFVIPVRWFARVARDDLVEPAFSGIAWLNLQAWRALSASQNGQLRLYIGVAGAGLAVIVGFVVLR